MSGRVRRSLTLVEILITTVVLVLASMAVYSTLSNGLNIWKRANKISKSEKDIRLNLERIISEIRNTYKFSEIPFEGSRDSVFFPALIRNEDSHQYEVGQIKYIFDPDKGALFKEKRNYSQVYLDAEGEAEIVASNLESVTFSFCYFDSVPGLYKWKDDWEKEEQDTLPKAVKIRFLFKENGKKAEGVETVIPVPIGTGEQKKIIGGA